MERIPAIQQKQENNQQPERKIKEISQYYSSNYSEYFFGSIAAGDHELKKSKTFSLLYPFPSSR